MKWPFTGMNKIQPIISLLVGLIEKPRHYFWPVADTTWTVTLLALAMGTALKTSCGQQLPVTMSDKTSSKPTWHYHILPLEFKVMIDGKLEIVENSRETVVAIALPLATSSIFELQTTSAVKELKITDSQIKHLKALGKSLEVPKPILLSLMGQPTIDKETLQKLKEMDAEISGQAVSVLSSEQRLRLEQLANVRWIQKEGLVTWLNNLSEPISETEMAIVKNWAQTSRKELDAEYAQFRESLVMDIEKLFSDDISGPWSKIKWQDHLSDDPFLLFLQLSIEPDKIIGEDLYDFLTAANPHISVSPLSNVSLIYPSNSSPRNNLFSLLSTNFKGGVEILPDQISEMSRALVAETTVRNEEIQSRLAVIREKIFKGESGAYEQFEKLKREVDVDAIKRMEGVLIPFQRQFVRELCFFRAIQVCGPWFVASSSEVKDFSLTESVKKSMSNLRVKTNDEYQKLVDKLIRRTWADLKAKCPRVVEIVERKIGRPTNLPENSAVWIFK